MALTWNQLSAITQSKIVPKLVDNVFNSNPLLQRQRQNGLYKTVDGGTSVIYPLEYDDLSSAGWYSGSETLSTSDNETITGAEFTWKQAYANITIIRADELKNMGDQQKVDLVKSKTKTAEKTLALYLSEGLFSSGTEAKSIVGLGSMLSNTTSIGGISATDFSWWRPGSLDSTTTTDSLSAMQTVYNACSDGNDTPSVIISGLARYNSYWALLQPQQRFVDTQTAKAGWTSLMFNGTPYIVDRSSASAARYFINEKYFYLTAHSQENFRFEPFQTPTNQNVKVAKIYWMGVCGLSNRRRIGGQTALAA